MGFRGLIMGFRFRGPIMRFRALLWGLGIGFRVLYDGV